MTNGERAIVDPAPLRRAGPPRTLQPSEHRLLLWGADFAVAGLAIAVALYLWSITAGLPFTLAFVRDRVYWFLVVPLWVLALVPARTARVAFSARLTAAAIAQVAGLLLLGYLLLYFYAPRAALPRLVVLHVLWEASLLTLAWRLAYIWLFTATSLRRRLLLVGIGPAAQEMQRTLTDAAGPHWEVAGFVRAAPASQDSDGRGDAAPATETLAGLPVIAGWTHLVDQAQRLAVSEVVVALDAASVDAPPATSLPGADPVPTAGREEALLTALLECQERGIDVVPMTTAYEHFLHRVPVRHLAPDWLLSSFLDTVRTRDASRLVKRWLDVAGGVGGLAVCLLVGPFIGLAIWLDTGRPIFFRQARVGLGGRLFKVLKFRTMVTGAESDGAPVWAAPADSRTTRVGRWLRKTRLDELPQFLNVLRGDMSLVGPRPERPEFVEVLHRRVPFYRYRQLVRPGLTGWAQIHLPYADSIERSLEKLEYDLYYVKHRSLGLDLTIALRTVGAVVGMRGR